MSLNDDDDDDDDGTHCKHWRTLTENENDFKRINCSAQQAN